MHFVDGMHLKGNQSFKAFATGGDRTFSCATC